MEGEDEDEGASEAEGEVEGEVEGEGASEVEGEGASEVEGEVESESEGEGILFNESQEDDESEAEGESKGQGQATDKKSMIGGNSKYFLKRLYDKEPRLFLKKKEGLYDAYERSCPRNYNRQPVILTDDEKKKLDENYKGSYDIALPYGTAPDKKFWYICPRYWCMPENRPLTQQQINEGQCGGPDAIIPQGEDAGPRKTIYEFTDKKEHIGKDGEYRQHYPGFLDKETHPNPAGCMPCCFKSMSIESQITRRKQCGVNDDEIVGLNIEKKKERKGKKIAVESAIEPVAPEKAKNNLYIVGNDKYPISQHRWGFLPLSVELFLRTNNSTSTEKNNAALIRKNETPVLRYGVQRSANQSFVACLADIYTYYKNISVPTTKDMREIIADAITLDSFLKFNNGSLMSIFQPKKVNISDIDVEKYSNTDFYKSFTNLSNPSQNNFLKDTIASYENFLKFLRDDDSYIDHTYLWDVVSSPDLGVFGNGLNMVIMELTDNDVTNDVAIICPKNSSYSTYDPKKGTVLLLKQDDVYEPIYLYGNTAGGITIATQNAVKIFTKKNIPTKLQNVLEMIQKTSNKYCKSHPSMPKVYEFKENIPAKQVYDILITNNFIVNSQVMNYRGKIIGLMVSLREGDTSSLYIPTYPSALINNVSRIIIDDVVWSSYVETRDKLTSINEKTDGDILCKPKFKVVEDGLIIGILTETNQLIQISPYEQNIIDDDISSVEVSNYKDNGYTDADKSFAISDAHDDLRIKTVQNISLETHFYNSFRNKIRILLNDYANKDIREKIMGILNNPEYLYKIKLKKLEILLKFLLRNDVSFDEISEDALQSIRKQSTFISNISNNAICLSNSNKLCIPKTNLINSAASNENIYFARIADELIRYKRVRLFMLESKKYFNVTNSDYFINNDEILLLNSLIFGNYFDDLIPFDMNEYIQNVTFDIANPRVTTERYSNNVPLKEQFYLDSKTVDFQMFSSECVEKTMSIGLGGTRNWKNILPVQSKETVVRESYLCSYFVLIYVFKKLYNRDESVDSIKTMLWEAYKELFANYQLKIFEILKKQGKREMVDAIKKNKYDFETAIMAEGYYLTSFDLWVLAAHMKLPIILFSHSKLMTNQDMLVCGGDMAKDRFFFVRCEKEMFRIITPSAELVSLPEISKMIGTSEFIPYNISIETFLQNVRVTISLMP